MKIKDYKPVTMQEALGYITEECGEVQQAIGKCFRFGFFGKYENGEVNLDAVTREIKDLEYALSVYKNYLENG